MCICVYVYIFLSLSLSIHIYIYIYTCTYIEGYVWRFLRAQKGNIYFTELPERVEYGNYDEDRITAHCENMALVKNTTVSREAMSFFVEPRRFGAAEYAVIC